MLGFNFRKFLKKNYFSSVNIGESPNEKIYLKIQNELKSFWHDVPMKGGHGVYNMVIEIPAFSRTIMEMNTKEKLNPLMIKHPKPLPKQTEFPIRIRNYAEDPQCNYGFFPQTYSSKEVKFRNLYCGDGDPLDVVEMGGPFNYKAGDVIQVKLLGSFCLIDQGEVDWKIVVANVKAAENNSLDDSIKQMMIWFKMFKTFYGKKENVILDDNKYFSVEETIKVIEESHMEYNLLCSKML
jgi:inorganic pyrophosphatase